MVLINKIIIWSRICSLGFLLKPGTPQDNKWYCRVCVIRPRLTVITLQPDDGRRVLLISADHIPLADWAINENTVIPQSETTPVSGSHSPLTDPLIKVKESSDVAKYLSPRVLQRFHFLILDFLLRNSFLELLCGLSSGGQTNHPKLLLKIN